MTDDQRQPMRAQLVQAGITALGRDGKEADVTIRGVARAVGIAAPSVYHHFPDQHALLAAVVAETFRQFEASLVDAIESETQPYRRVRAGLLAYLDYAATSPGNYRTIFSRERPSRLAEVGVAAGRLYELIATELAAAAGDEPASPSGRERTMWLWIELHGVADLRSSHPRFGWPVDDDLVTELLQRVGVVVPGTAPNDEPPSSRAAGPVVTSRRPE